MSSHNKAVLNKLQIGLFALLFACANVSFADSDIACPPVAESPTPEMVQAAKRAARDHGFLWRISKDGRTSFLYGTIHMAKFAWVFPGPVVMQALRASDTVALELDMLDEDIQRRMVKGVALLRHNPLPEALEQRVRRQAEAVCVPYASLARLTPEFQVDNLSLMVGAWEGLYAAYAIDSVLAGMAHNLKKTVVSLETPEMQLQLLHMKDDQETISFVQDSLAELESGRELAMLRRIAKVWESADYAEMSHFDDWCECLNTPIERDLMKKLLDDRNPGLADRIDAIHASGKQVFAAVGSLHLFGSNGLPELLKKRGYRVERVDLKPLL